jgi:hypothetical protein
VAAAVVAVAAMWEMTGKLVAAEVAPQVHRAIYLYRLLCALKPYLLDWVQVEQVERALQQPLV